MKTIQLISITPEELTEIIDEGVKKQMKHLLNELKNRQDEEELLTRDQACEFLQINSSTLWAWTNQGKVKAYKIGHRRYYKRSELMDCLTEIKK